MLGEIEWRGSGLRARLDAVPRLLAPLAWPAGTAAAATTAGLLVGTGRARYAALPLAGAVAVLLARVPAAGYVAVLWSVGTAVDLLALPQVGLSTLQFAPAEILMWLVLASIMFLRADVRRALIGLASQRESLLMAAFLAAVAGGVFVGVENGATLHDAAYDARLMLFYAAFWPALAALANPPDRALVLRLVSAGVIVVVILQAAQVIVGSSTRLFVIAASDVASTLTPDETGFLRVRPPGLTTVYVVAAFALARVIWGPSARRLGGWLMAGVALTGVILSLNRNMIVGLVLGLCVAALAAPQRRRFVVMAATLGLALSALILASQGSALQSDVVVSRVATLANYSELRSETLADRYYENDIALQRIRSHPIGGLGWGPPYGATLESSDAGFLVSQPRPFMHEQYLWIWMRAGLIGLVALVAMLVFAILNGTRWCRTRSETDGWLGAGVIVSVVALAASSNVAIYLTPPDSTVPLVGVLALAAVMRRDLARR